MNGYTKFSVHKRITNRIVPYFFPCAVPNKLLFTTDASPVQSPVPPPDSRTTTPIQAEKGKFYWKVLLHRTIINAGN